MPAIALVVAACEMLERQEELTLTVPLFGGDLGTLLAISQETADQSGAEIEITGSGDTVTVRLTRVRDKGEGQ
jgi:hypothetical protein